MNFCTRLEYLEFMRQTPALERMLADSGIHLFKLLVLRKRAKNRDGDSRAASRKPSKEMEAEPDR